MRTFVIGDIHGAAKALTEVIDQSEFNPDTDKLIVLGDVCDGWSGVVDAIRILNEIPNLVYMLGNHDEWVRKYLASEMDIRERIGWLNQGGQISLDAIESNNARYEVRSFLEKAVLFHEEDRRLFVHGGIMPEKKAENHDKKFLIWDRDLIRRARLAAIESEPLVTEYDEVFVGHTPTLLWNSFTPSHFNNVWTLDTGAGYGENLTIMDVESKVYWQSSPVRSLYEGENGR